MQYSKLVRRLGQCYLGNLPGPALLPGHGLASCKPAAWWERCFPCRCCPLQRTPWPSSCRQTVARFVAATWPILKVTGIWTYWSLAAPLSALALTFTLGRGRADRRTPACTDDAQSTPAMKSPYHRAGLSTLGPVVAFVKGPAFAQEKAMVSVATADCQACTATFCRTT